MKTILLIDEQDTVRQHLNEILGDIPDSNVIAIGRADLAQTLSGSQANLAIISLASALADDHQVLRYLDSQQMPTIIYGQESPEEADLLDRFAVFNCLNGPMDLNTFSGEIRKVLAKSGVAHISGVSLSSFLQLIELDRKTCTLRIKSNEHRGVLYFIDGEILDAHTEQTDGEEAALSIIGWFPAEIDLHETCRKHEKCISSPLGFLLIEQARRQDEQGHCAKPETDAPTCDRHKEQPISPEPKDGELVEPHSSPDLPEQAQKTLQLLTDSIMELHPISMLIAKRDGTILSEYNSNPQLNTLAVQTAMNTDILNHILHYNGPQYILLHHASDKKLLILAGEKIVIGLEITAETPAQVITASLSPLLKRVNPKLTITGNQC